MNFNNLNASSNDLPIAESTQIEKTAKTPLKRLRITLANRLGLNSNPNSPRETPSPKRTDISSPTLTKLDPQVYLDTQSNGFASRIVKYHEASEAKNRGIANKTYRRPGDFPIVNLEKSEINLNQKHANVPKVAKINIAPPINLVNASNASARSAIFRTGKNYGDSYPIDKLGPIEGRKPIKPTLPQDEPIVPINNDYDNAPIRNSLEALKEISRKRIHCDEIDGETNKKICADHEHDHNNAKVVNSSKRARDRTSPTYSSSSTDIQMKRYKNNDILSSLSSSILINTPKRSALNVDVSAQKMQRSDYKIDTTENALIDSCTVNKKPTESRVGTSNSDLPLHRPSEPIKPVTKSISDGNVPNPSKQPTKTQKLTLFNKDYDSSQNDRKKVNDDDEENSISFVKPKVKTSSIFSLNKNRDQKNKLAMMLSFLRGDESRDEVDSVAQPPSDKSNEKDEPKSTSANLSTITSVTFSTATTTSLLNAPSEVTKLTTMETPKVVNKISTEITKPTESTAAPTISLPTVVSTPPSSTTTTTSLQTDKAQSSAESLLNTKPTVTFNLPSSAAAATSTTVNTSNSSDSAPRLGGFAFSVTSPSKAVTADPISVSKTAIENKPAAPTFSFGLSPATTFGSSPAIKPAASAIPEIKPAATLLTTSTPTFGTTSNSTSMFSFGAKNQAPAVAVSTPKVSSTSVTSTQPSNTFTFGSNTLQSTSAPVFGSNTLTNVTSATSVTSTTNPTPSKPFSFGISSNKLETSGFQFGSTATTSAPSSFGSQSGLTVSSTAATTTATTNLFGSSTPVFGASNISSTQPKTEMMFGATTTNPSSTSMFSFGAKTQSAGTTSTPTVSSTSITSAKPSNAFVFGSNAAQTTPAPVFGLSNTSTSITTASAIPTMNPTPSKPFSFGTANTSNKPETNAFQFGNTATTTTASTNLFGNAQNTPVFGASNTISSIQPKPTNVFGTATSNQTNNTPVFGGPSQPSQSTFGTNNNLFSTTTTSANLNQSTNSAFGSTTSTASSGVFAFGQTASNTPSTTASTGIFGSSNTNTNTNTGSPFVFGQNNTSTTPSQSSGIFGAKPAETSLTAPPAFGSSSPAFNFTAKPAFGNQSETKPSSAFSFNASNNTQPASAPVFGSNAAAPTFGVTNGLGSSFSFSSTNSQPQQTESKPFAFGAPSSAPVAASPAPFSFNASATAPTANAFQFNAAPTNIFSIGPSSSGNTTLAKTGRPMRTATRRMK